jgi:hypothetical protein
LAQFVVVDQVLLAKRDADHTLHHQRLNLVFDEGRIARVSEATDQPTGQPDHAVGSVRLVLPQGDSALLAFLL